MKKLMSSVAVILLSLTLQVTAQTSNLVVFDQQGEQFYAIVNGVKQNSTPQTNVRITGLAAPAAYKVTILFADNTIAQVDKNIYLQNPATEVTANVVIKKDGEHVLRWVSETPLAQASAPVAGQNTIVYSTTPPPVQGTTTVVTQQTTTDPNGGTVTMNVGGMGAGMNVNVTGATSQTTVTTTTTTSSSGDMGQAPPPANQTVYVDGYGGPVGCPMPMTHEDYEGAKNTINAKTFENDKLTIAEQIASSNCLTAGQVKGIMALFTFENTKLDFAKFAYGHTYDKGNYYKVNDAFQFSSSTDALNQFINSQH
jgi:hypothetical protein